MLFQQCAEMITELKYLIMCGDLDQLAKFLNKNTVQFNSWQDYAMLLEVLRDGNTKMAKLLVENGFRVNYEPWNYHSTTPLHLAVKLRCFDLVKTLLDKGARLDICNEEYQTPLFIAAFVVQSEPLIDLLLEKVPLKRFMCEDECVSGHLHAACMRNRVDVAKRLLQHEVDIDDAIDLESNMWYGYTPLHFAVKFGCKETAEFLIDCGADVAPHAVDSCGFTPLHLAYELGNTELVDLFLQYCVLQGPIINNPVDKNNLSHFHIACARNNVEVVQEFLDLMKIDIDTGIAESKCRNKSTPYDKTPLQLAIANDCKDVAQLLLKRNATISDDDAIVLEKAFGMKLCDLIASKRLNSDESDFQDRPPQYESLTDFHEMCYSDSIAAVKNFVRSNNVDVNRRIDPDSAFWPGFTGLHFVVKSSHYCEPNHGASIDDDDKDRRRKSVSIRILPERGSGKAKEKEECLVEYLVHLGADITLPNGFGVSALELAIQEVTSNEVPDMGIINCFLRAAPEKVTQHLTSKGLTQFHMLCANHATTTETLESIFKPEMINQAVDADFPMIGGYTPLHLSAVSGSSMTMIWLLAHGADSALVTPTGESALHLVIDRCEKDDPHNLLGHSPLLCRLMVSSNPISRESGKSQLHLICEILSPLELKYALKTKIANVNARVGSHSVLEVQGDTALHYALRRTEEEEDQYARWLLEHGVDVNVSGSGGNFPLHTGASDDVHYHWYKMLVTPVSINAVNDEGRTPLHELCAESFLFDDDFYEPHLGEGKLSYLLTHGADINICDKKGRTPFGLKLSKGPEDHPSLITLAKHCRKLSLMRLYVSEQNESCYQQCKRMLALRDYNESQFTQICEKEKLKMKATKLDKNLTFYDIIFYNEVHMEKLAANKLLEKKAKSSKLLSVFPNYGYLIRLQYQKGLRRKILVNRYRTVINALVGFNLPLECWDLILTYLTSDDMSILCDA